MSDTSIPVLRLTRTAGETIAAERFVAADGTYPAAGAHALGVTETAAKSGEHIAVMTLGLAVVEAADAITEGALVQTDATGKARPHIAAGAGAGKALGRAMTAAATAGDLIQVHLIPN